MEIDQLRNFLKVASRQNFTRAAEEVGLSQSALSRSISRLEEELGQPVFERQTRKVTLTDAGELLRSRALQIVSLVDDVRAEISDDGQKGRIRISAIPTIAPYLLPELLKKFSHDYPQATLLVQEETTENLLKALGDGSIDLGILALPLDAHYLEIESLFEEELLLVLAADHPLASQSTVRMEQLETLPFILLGEAHCLTDSILTFCRQKSFAPVSVERTSQLVMVQELVTLNHGVSLIPAMARQCDQSDRRVYRSVSSPRPTRTVAMVWNPYRYQTRLLKAFQEHLRQHVGGCSPRSKRIRK